MSSCSLCGNLSIFNFKKPINGGIFKASSKLSSCEHPEDLKNKKYLFKGGMPCNFCDIKLYSYRHINEHLSYEHGLHIELEELVFFIPSDFKGWMIEMQKRTKTEYEEYICPASLINFKNVPKKTFYRCLSHTEKTEKESKNKLLCPSSLETYMEDGVLKVFFWRSHLCKTVMINSLELNAEVLVNGKSCHLEREESSLPIEYGSKVDKVSSSYPNSKESQIYRKEMVKRFAERVSRANLSNIDPYFNETLDKVIPFLNKLLDKVDQVEEVLPEGQIFSKNQSSQNLDNSYEDEAFKSSGSEKRSNVESNFHEIQIAKKKMKKNENNNYSINLEVSLNKNRENEIDLDDDNVCNELFIHNGFDHMYTKVC